MSALRLSGPALAAAVAAARADVARGLPRAAERLAALESLLPSAGVDACPPDDSSPPAGWTRLAASLERMWR